MLPPAVQDAIELYEWEQVPVRVGELLKQAKPIRQTLQQVIRNLPESKGDGRVFYNPDRHALFVSLSDADTEQLASRYENALRAIKGITNVSVDYEVGHPGPEWMLIKRAAPLGILGGLQDTLGKVTGGPSPLTNAIAGGLLTGGLGYGTGWLLQHLLPKRFVRRGPLAKTMGIIGAGIGAAPGMMQWYTNAQTDQSGGPFKSLWKPNADVEYGPETDQEMDAYWRSTGNDVLPYNGKQAAHVDLSAMQAELVDLPEVNALFKRSTEGLCKYAELPWNSGADLRPVPMDAFNRAIWNDVRAGMTASKNPFGTKPWQGDNTQELRTPPPVAAATTAINTGIQDMYGGASVLSPRHFIKGLATAGVDLATAHVVGGTLGALGGLTPLAQKKLQDFGLWGGLLRGTVGSMMGMR